MPRMSMDDVFGSRSDVMNEKMGYEIQDVSDETPRNCDLCNGLRNSLGLCLYCRQSFCLVCFNKHTCDRPEVGEQIAIDEETEAS